MRFEPIRTYVKSWEGTAIPEHIDNLVNDFGAKSWCISYCEPMSLVERLLVDGKATRRYDEFGSTYNLPFDHSACIKCVDGRTFVLTMAYADKDYFHECFNKLLAEYRAKKFKIRARIEDGYDSYYKSKAWREQIYADADIQAVVVDGKYKIRTNGDIAAIIATSETLKAMGLK